MKLRISMCAVLCAGLLISTLAPATASPELDVAAAFGQFIVAENTHDINALSKVLWDSPNFLWISRGITIFGRTAALDRFTTMFGGTWQLAPVMSDLRVTMLSGTTAQLYVPIDFTIGAPGQPPAVSRFLMNQTLVKTPAGWQIANILPILVPPAPAPAPAATK